MIIIIFSLENTKCFTRYFFFQFFLSKQTWNNSYLYMYHLPYMCYHIIICIIYNTMNHF